MFEFSKLDATNRHLLCASHFRYLIHIQWTHSIWQAFFFSGSGYKRELHRCGPSLIALSVCSASAYGLQQWERHKILLVSLSFEDQTLALKNDKAVLNWCWQYQQLLADKNCYIQGCIEKLSCLFSINTLRKWGKKITEVSNIQLRKFPGKNQRGDWESRLLSDTSCSNLFQTDWTFYKSRFLIILLLASWTEVSWLRTIRKVSSLSNLK